MLTVDEKQQIIKDYQVKENDTGSAAVQIALLTADIRKLTEHFKTHKHDNHSRRGLQKKINQRRKLLDYVKRKNAKDYYDLIKKLGLRR
ncbi:MAG: 30S ribosomal protein S15 [Pseudomonadota bacterium]